MSSVLALPTVVIEADGVVLAAEEVRTLASILVRQGLSLPTLCELTFTDPPAPWPGVASLAPGAALQVRLKEHREPLFVGEVTAVEHVYEPAHRREIRVRAYDVLHRLRKRQSVRSHLRVTARDLARELASDLGLAVESDESGPVWQTLIQHRQSDLELLTEIAERAGLYLTLRGERLHLVTLDGIGDPLPLELGRSLLEARIEVNGDPACRSVKASGWNPLLAEAHQGRAVSPRVGRDVAAEIPPGDIGGSGERHLVDQAAPADPHADATAQAELDVRVAREVSLWGVAEGDPRLQPGARINLVGVAESLVGRYVVSEVTHTMDERSGFVSEFSTTPPMPRARPSGAVVSLGIVTRVDDPETLGRVKVSLPTYENVETDWMGVLGLGAGPGKGLMLLPDVGDQVLVLFAHGDPGQGIVLGGLYGRRGPPDSGVEGGGVRRYTLLTPGGQRILLDDSGGLMRLENQGGSYLELSPQRVRVHAAVDLELEAPGRAVLIRGSSIDFESA